ncbi:MULTISPECIES: NERD domain-containing protein [Heyndrickxia]|uniref:NERD domain-containing protein n=1 Tax=Heyndrickxia TaxID=2837504 RepID=UPI002DC00687|nr:NERD domain-containing protein [Weizmannia sp. CD-2023]MEC2304487.1 NERD domain-containing protein [Weizmannia sp. CD-2023]MEC2339922.1 NERD domain-containing protein [Weizmannia sp. CD-2023]
MIVKQREYPAQIRAGEALLGRLPERHPLYGQIAKDVKKWDAKYKREKRADRFLEILPSGQFYVYHALPITNTCLDGLILTRNFVLITGYTHLSGAIFPDPAFAQLIQQKGGKEKGWPEPFACLQKQREILCTWARMRHLPELPLEYLLVLCHEGAELKMPVANSADELKICPASQVVYKVTKMQETYSQPVLDGKHFKKWHKHLLECRENPGICPWPVDQSEMYTGVGCPLCRRFEMDFNNGAWHCQVCGHASKDAHRKAIEEFYLLFGRDAPDEALCSFLRVDALTAAQIVREAAH